MSTKRTKHQVELDSARVRNLRDALHMTTREFGKLIGRSHATVVQWENGNTEIPEMGIKLLEYLEKEHAKKLKHK